MPGLTQFPRALFSRLAGSRAERRNRRLARRKPWGTQPTEFVFYPQNRTIGSYLTGQDLVMGKVTLAGRMLELGKASLWDIVPPSPAYETALHRFVWLDDLVADGGAPAQEQAREWTAEWMHRYLQGTGPGWQAEMAGSRLLRWVIHARFLMRGMDDRMRGRFFLGLWKHVCYLSEMAGTAPVGKPRIEALTGLIHATLSLNGQEDRLKRAVAELTRECRALIGEEGAVASRNPEELLELFARLVWSASALTEANRKPDPGLTEAIARIAPTLRNLRLGDGSLARFHGGSSGREGRLDQALSDSGVKGTDRDGAAMGYARLSGGRLVAVMDASDPPIGPASAIAHASALAIEVTSGRRAMITNTGPGHGFGRQWERACRHSAAHSTLLVDNRSSVAFTTPTARQPAELIAIAPKVVVKRGHDANGVFLRGTQDGYLAEYGLVHERRLYIDTGGAALDGSDRVFAPDRAAAGRFRRAAHEGSGLGLPIAVHFHLHPDVTVDNLRGFNAANLILKSGEVWEFRQTGAELKVEKSAFLQPGRKEPTPSRQIVLTTRISAPDHVIHWTLIRPVKAGASLRDVVVDEPGAS